MNLAIKRVQIKLKKVQIKNNKNKIRKKDLKMMVNSLVIYSLNLKFKTVIKNKK